MALIEAAPQRSVRSFRRALLRVFASREYNLRIVEMDSFHPMCNHEHGREHSCDDAALIRNAQAGCTECFAVLFRRYCKLVYSIGWKVLRQSSEVDDLVQDVFLAIFLKRHSYDAARASVKTWIAQAAYFKALVRRRDMHAKRPLPLETASDGDRSQAFGGVESAALVEEGLALLNSRQRRIIELILLEGYTLGEAAAVLKESLANTKNQYYRGMKSLRGLLRSPRDASVPVASARQLRVAPEISDPLIPAAEI